MDDEILFPIDAEEEPIDAFLSTQQDGMLQVHLAYLLSSSASSFQRQVLLEAQRACAQLDAAGTQTDSLAVALAARGYTVCLRRTNPPQTPATATSMFRALSHTFILVAVPPRCRLGGATAAGCSCGCGWEASELVVDPGFADQFMLPRASRRYQGLQAMLPPLFVGPAWQLEHLIDWLGSEVAWSYRQSGELLPPWRHKGSLLSKWLAEAVHDTPVAPPRPAPPCKSPPSSLQLRELSSAQQQQRQRQRQDLQRARSAPCAGPTAPLADAALGLACSLDSPLLSLSLDSAGPTSPASVLPRAAGPPGPATSNVGFEVRAPPVTPSAGGSKLTTLQASSLSSLVRWGMGRRRAVCLRPLDE